MTADLQPVKISFHDKELTTIEKDGQIYVVMRPIVEGMGLEWSGQQKKFNKQPDKFGCVHMYIPTKGGIQEMLCIPLKKLNGWLFSVNPEKVDPNIKPVVELYQEECFEALYDYWHVGAAVNPRAGLEKQCSSCGIIKPLVEFPKDARCKDGHRRFCNQCQSPYPQQPEQSKDDHSYLKDLMIEVLLRDDVKKALERDRLVEEMFQEVKRLRDKIKESVSAVGRVQSSACALFPDKNVWF